MRGSDAPLRQKIDAAIERLLADGTIRDIYARYGIEHRPPDRRAVSAPGPGLAGSWPSRVLRPAC